MNFCILNHADNKKVIGAIVQDRTGISYAVKGDAIGPIDVLLTRGRIVVEDKTDARTVIRRTVKRTDGDYLDMIRYKLTPPIISATVGVIQETSRQQALRKLWQRFSGEECPEIKMV